MNNAGTGTKICVSYSRVMLPGVGNTGMHKRVLELPKAALTTGRAQQIGVVTEFRNQYHRKDHDRSRQDHIYDLILRNTGCRTGTGFLLSLLHITHLPEPMNKGTVSYQINIFL